MSPLFSSVLLNAPPLLRPHAQLHPSELGCSLLLLLSVCFTPLWETLPSHTPYRACVALCKTQTHIFRRKFTLSLISNPTLTQTVYRRYSGQRTQLRNLTSERTQPHCQADCRLQQIILTFYTHSQSKDTVAGFHNLLLGI